MNIANVLTNGISGLLKSDSSSGTYNTANALNNSNFLELLITQITNQNPLEPMSNSEMVQQMASFQTVEKLNELNDRVGAMMIYNNLMNSIEMMGKQVTIIDSNGNTVTGKVEGIRIESGFPRVVVNGVSYDYTNITAVN